MLRLAIVLGCELTLLVSLYEYPRDKPFLLTMISYFQKTKIKRAKRKKSHKSFQSYQAYPAFLTELELVGLNFFYILIYLFLNMEPFSVKMACLLWIQNKIQAVWAVKGTGIIRNGSRFSSVAIVKPLGLSQWVEKLF